jgi:hypothetical protein
MANAAPAGQRRAGRPTPRPTDKNAGMDNADVALRNLTYRMFVELGRAPTVQEVAASGGITVDEVSQVWRRLSEQQAIVLEDGAGEGATELRMVNPFSAVATPHRVQAAGRWWYANCAWDAFGICAALHVDGRIAATCPDCGQGIDVETHDGRPDDDTLLFHCLVPAAQWWDDIVFT